MAKFCEINFQKACLKLVKWKRETWKGLEIVNLNVIVQIIIIMKKHIKFNDKNYILDLMKQHKILIMIRQKNNHNWLLSKVMVIDYHNFWKESLNR